MGTSTSSGNQPTDEGLGENNQLVERVKWLQKHSREAKQHWWKYCGDHGKVDFDPIRHDDEFLQGFVNDWALGQLTAHQEVAEKVQNSLGQNRETWYNFCSQHGTSNLDPSKHDDTFLHKFMDVLEDGHDPEERNVRFNRQFHKTNICSFWLKNACQRGSHCTYAHGEVERKGRPNLSRTSMCQFFLTSGACSDQMCPYAHGWNELRATNCYQKTTMCRYFSFGTCHRGAACRHAHHASELCVVEKTEFRRNLASDSFAPRPIEPMRPNGGYSDQGGDPRMPMTDRPGLEMPPGRFIAGNLPSPHDKMRSIAEDANEWHYVESASASTQMPLPVGPLPAGPMNLALGNTAASFRPSRHTFANMDNNTHSQTSMRQDGRFLPAESSQLSFGAWLQDEMVAQRHRGISSHQVDQHNANQLTPMSLGHQPYRGAATVDTMPESVTSLDHDPDNPNIRSQLGHSSAANPHLPAHFVFPTADSLPSMQSDHVIFPTMDSLPDVPASAASTLENLPLMALADVTRTMPHAHRHDLNSSANTLRSFPGQRSSSAAEDTSSRGALNANVGHSGFLLAPGRPLPVKVLLEAMPPYYED